MKFLWNGDAAGTRQIIRDANNGVHNFRLLNDDGTVTNITSFVSLSLELYTDAVRSTAATLSITVNDSNTPTLGYAVEEILQANVTAASLPVGTYYAFFKYVGTGTVTYFSTNFFTVTVI